MPHPVATVADRSWLSLAGRNARTAGVLVVIVLAAGLGLACEGRRWWCEQGDWWPWSTGIQSRHTSQHLVDPYSLTHVLHGVLLLCHALGHRETLAGRGEVGRGHNRGSSMGSWGELALGIDRYRTGTVALGYEGDSILNSVGDILACVVGFLLAARLPLRATVAVFLLVDVGLVIVYRDNLLLNMLMLIHPIEAVRRWQAGG